MAPTACPARLHDAAGLLVQTETGAFLFIPDDGTPHGLTLADLAFCMPDTATAVPVDPRQQSFPFLHVA